MSFFRKAAGATGVLGMVAYIILGLVQWAAFYSLIRIYFDLHWLLAGPITFLLSYIPLLGTIGGVVGAKLAWHWTWLGSIGLFVGPWLVIIGIGIIFSSKDN